MNSNAYVICTALVQLVFVPSPLPLETGITEEMLWAKAEVDFFLTVTVRILKTEATRDILEALCIERVDMGFVTSLRLFEMKTW